jgi:spore coat polysaccharide biosynthesis protein SpsF (cytidylyltransferase family)
LCAPEYMDQGVDYLLENNSDFVSYTGLPLGATPNILRTSALERAVREKPHDDTSTGFFRYLEQSGSFRVDKVAVDEPAHRHATVRMTLDYPEDLAFFRAVFAILDQPGHTGSLTELVALLQARPELVDINQGLDEAYRAHFDAGLRGS